MRALPAITLLAWTVAALSQTGDCPQQRSTYKAPDELYTLANPHRPTPEQIAVVLSAALLTNRTLADVRFTPPAIYAAMGAWSNQ